MEDQFTEEVKNRKEQGQSERQMAAELNVSRSKVHNALQGLKLLEIGSASVPEDKIRAIIREELERAHSPEGEEKASNEFPVIRKMGGGMEMIAPEAVLKQYMGGTPEGEVELRAIMKFRAAMLMVMDLVNIQKGSAEADAKRMEPVLRLMKETREEQDAAAARAKASSEDIADRAAQLRAEHGLGTPDAIHLATALECGAEVFVTNDRDLPAVQPVNETAAEMMADLVNQDMTNDMGQIFARLTPIVKQGPTIEKNCIKTGSDVMDTLVRQVNAPVKAQEIERRLQVHLFFRFLVRH